MASTAIFMWECPKPVTPAVYAKRMKDSGQTCASFLTFVTLQPFETRPSATGPTKGVIAVIARYGLSVNSEDDATFRPSDSSK